jgi:cytoskeletal protein RodZ
MGHKILHRKQKYKQWATKYNTENKKKKQWTKKNNKKNKKKKKRPKKKTQKKKKFLFSVYYFVAHCLYFLFSM